MKLFVLIYSIYNLLLCESKRVVYPEYHNITYLLSRPDLFNTSFILENFNETDLTGFGCGNCPCLCFRPCHAYTCCSVTAGNDKNCLMCDFNGDCKYCKKGYTLPYGQDQVCTRNVGCSKKSFSTCIKCKKGFIMWNGLCKKNRNCKRRINKVCVECKNNYVLLSNGLCIKT